MMDEGYWTFKQLRKKMEENGLTFKEYPDGKIKIDLDSRTKTVGLRNLTGILGYRSSNGPTVTNFSSIRRRELRHTSNVYFKKTLLLNCLKN
jgi:hypothetical protein